MAVCGATNIVINSHRDYSKTNTFTDCDGNPVDLTGYAFLMQVRATKCAEDPVILELSTENGGIIISSPATNGKIEILITDEQAATLPVGIFYYDIYWVTAAGVKQTIMFGAFVNNLSVTRP